MFRSGTAQLLTILLLLTGRPATIAQTSTSLHYTLTVDSSDLSGYNVDIRIEHPPRRFRLAMATHNEYDDRFWRYVTGFHVTRPAFAVHTDSAVWAVITTGDEVTVSYRISLPPPAPLHFSHRPFLTSYGGLVGDLHSFMYIVDYLDIPCALTLRLPPGWTSADGIYTEEIRVRQTWGKRYYGAVNVSSTSQTQLLDAPILIGRLHRWTFTTDSIRHDVVYLSPSPNLNFDTVSLINNLQKIAHATYSLTGGFPFLYYNFLIEDASAGALEHASSLTIGAKPSDLNNPASGIYEDIAHEFFHAWNGMSIRPSGYTELNYGPQQLTTSLWFTEGVTMLCADLISRRIGLPTEDSTRLSHLTHLITRYYRDTGNSVLPPAKVSLADYAQPGPLGDYSASTHLQGELLGTCLDLLIRDATEGRYSIDALMKEVNYICSAGKQPLTDSVIDSAAAIICQNNAAVHRFFREHLYQGKPIDFATYLHLLGLKIQHDQPTAKDPQGRRLPDIRVYSWILRDDTSLRIGISNPKGCWAKAGLHTGDIIMAINGRPTNSRQDFQSAIRNLHIGDTARVTVKKQTGTNIVPVYMTGYTTPLITITEDPAATPKQKRLFRAWSSGAP
ncbi:MAG TPA: PDZ domain-containing protein [Puia sp.]|jgi:predicted metalloprotease with PDZ domain|nr:PDZ domain-containing protein [Puia sp.]